MRPQITCHMITSLDGRLHPERWNDPLHGQIQDLISRHYEATADRIGADGWIVGRKTMASYVQENADHMPLLNSVQIRPAYIQALSGRRLCIVIDPAGRLDYQSGELDGDIVVTVLSQRVANSYLEHLRDVGVSYVFAGPDGHDIASALEVLGTKCGVKHLLLEGGGITNGAFLAAGLLDATSTLICPAIDGQTGIPSIFEAPAVGDGERSAHGLKLDLVSCEVLDGGVIWLRHAVARV